MAEIEIDACERCGEIAEGKRRWMFDNLGARREFYCFRCDRVRRIYGRIGLTLLLGLVSALTVWVIWLTQFAK
jgi:hypothetical protein